jgi:hypothetical protein
MISDALVARAVRIGVVSSGALGLFWPLAACDVDEPCDEGQRHVQGGCIVVDLDDASTRPAADAASEGGAEDASSADDDASSANECSEDRDAILGETCSSDDGCNCAAPYCAKTPGAAIGTCTVFCDPAANDCPGGYSCFDLSALGVQGYEPFCIPE